MAATAKFYNSIKRVEWGQPRFFGRPAPRGVGLVSCMNYIMVTEPIFLC